MSGNSPNIVIIAGPNGAGKSTTAPSFVNRWLGITRFVNADTIASGLSAFDPESVALSAGKIMWERINELATEQESFAFETTLASRSFAPWLKRRRDAGYRINLLFLWLQSPELAVARVKNRVDEGGHSIPPDVVRRRYKRGLSNLIRLYLPITHACRVVDASAPDKPRMIAEQLGNSLKIEDEIKWKLIQEVAL